MSTERILEFQPRTIGQLLDQAIRLYRNNFWTFTGIIALMQVPFTLIQLTLNYFTVNESGVLRPAITSMEDLGPYIIGLIIVLASIVFIQGFAAAALTQAISDFYLGEKIGIIEAYRKVKRSWISLLGALFLLFLFMIPLFIWTLIPCIGWLTGPGMFVFVGMMLSPLIAPSVVLEKRRAYDAIKRAWGLAMKRFWWLLAFVIILGLFSYIVVTGPTQIIGLIFQSRLIGATGTEEYMNVYRLLLVVQTLLGLIMGILYFPLRSTGIILAYFDLRVRSEGFDLAVLAHQADPDVTDVVDLASLGLQPVGKFRIELSHLGYFAALTVGAVVVYFAFATLSMLLLLPLLGGM
jgi:hypothetical protein